MIKSFEKLDNMAEKSLLFWHRQWIAGGIVIVRPPEVTILLGEEDIGGFLVVEEGAFFTGMALGTVSTFPSDFFKLSVVPPFILTTSVSELKLSISSLPSSKGSPFLNHTPLFLALSKIEKYHSL